MCVNLLPSYHSQSCCVSLWTQPAGQSLSPKQGKTEIPLCLCGSAPIHVALPEGLIFPPCKSYRLQILSLLFSFLCCLGSKLGKYLEKDAFICCQPIQQCDFGSYASGGCTFYSVSLAQTSVLLLAPALSKQSIVKNHSVFVLS